MAGEGYKCRKGASDGTVISARKSPFCERTTQQSAIKYSPCGWRPGGTGPSFFPLPSCLFVLAMAMPWECGTMPRRPVGRGMLVLCWCLCFCNSHDQKSRLRMTSPSTGWMGTGSRTVTNFVSFVGEGPTKIFPGGQLPTMTPSLLMGCILCLQQISAKKGVSQYTCSALTLCKIVVKETALCHNYKALATEK